VYLFWWGGEISNNEHIYFQRRYSLPLRFLLWKGGIFMPFGLLAPLALAGGWLAWRRRPASRLLLGFVLSLAAAAILFFVCSRFRQPVVPALCILGVAGVRALVADRRQAARVALPLAALIVLLNIDPYGIEPAVFGSRAMSLLERGIYYASVGEDDVAMGLLAEAAEADPGHPGPRSWMGTLFLRQHRYGEAEDALRLATRGDPVRFRDEVSRADKELGRVYLETGRPELAVAVFQAALDLRSDYADAWLGLGYAARDLGRTAEAERCFRRVLELEPGQQAATVELERLGSGREHQTPMEGL